MPLFNVTYSHSWAIIGSTHDTVVTRMSMPLLAGMAAREGCVERMMAIMVQRDWLETFVDRRLHTDRGFLLCLSKSWLPCPLSQTRLEKYAARGSPHPTGWHGIC